MTAGPCTEAEERVRQDISEGATGLPVRLALRVLDRTCKPIARAKVNVWHTSAAGSYSGDTPNNAFCLKTPSEATKHYFRGVAESDENGIVKFDTCFPGWYPGRAIHIHFAVTAAGLSTTSQVFFEQALIDEIFASHPDYRAFGRPDTPNAADGVSRGGIAQMTVTTARMADGAMLAHKDIIALT